MTRWPRSWTRDRYGEDVPLNLVLNARDAMPRGGTVSVRLQRESLPPPARGRARGQTGRLRDPRGGRHRSRHGSATQRQFSSHFSRRSSRGTGRGSVAMVFGAMRQCRLRRAASRRPEQGATFKLWFPYVPAAPVRASVEPAEPAKSHARILLVEDNPAVSRVTAAMLKAGGYVVEVVSNATDAMRMWRRTTRICW